MPSNNQTVLHLAQQARSAARLLASASTQQRQAALVNMATLLQAARADVMAANADDSVAATQADASTAMMKRLIITDKIFSYMHRRLLEVAALPDPLGRILTGHTRPDGLQVRKISVPLGVIGIIYEARPNVTTDAAAVALKSGNAVILRGGSEARRTNAVLTAIMQQAISQAGLPETAVQSLDQPGHDKVHELLKMDQYIDVIIPRGGKELIAAISRESRIPVIKHYDGICHLYLAAEADTDMAVAVTVNAKCERPEVCNALETLLVDVAAAARLLPAVCSALTARNVELRGCSRCRDIVPSLLPATEEDWHTEYLDLILSIRIVDGLPEAIRHINEYGSGHTDGIITDSLQAANDFLQYVDSASVLVNAFDPPVRRRRLRHGRRGRHQHRPSACPRTGRLRRIDFDQMAGHRPRHTPSLTSLCCPASPAAKLRNPI